MKTNITNLNVNLGKDTSDNDVYLDLEQERLHLTLLVGTTGSGKSIFHNNLYNELSKQNTSEEIGFVFLDSTRVDFMDWQSPYLFLPPSTGDEAINVLEKIALTNEIKTLFIHIEECDLFIKFTKRMKQVLTKVLKNKNNIYIIFSTSRPSKEDVLQDWLMNMVDLKVIFNLASNTDCATLEAGNDPLDFKKGEKLIIYKNNNIFCQPFTDKKTKDLENFQLI